MWQVGELDRAAVVNVSRDRILSSPTSEPDSRSTVRRGRTQGESSECGRFDLTPRVVLCSTRNSNLMSSSSVRRRSAREDRLIWNSHSWDKIDGHAYSS